MTLRMAFAALLSSFAVGVFGAWFDGEIRIGPSATCGACAIEEAVEQRADSGETGEAAYVALCASC